MMHTMKIERSRMEGTMDEPVTPEALLAAFVGGDRTVFEGIVRDFHRRLLHYAYSFLSDWEECKDIVQESFTRLYQRSHTIRGNPQAWLFKVTRNLCLDLKRKWKRRGGNGVENIAEFPGNPRPHPDTRLEVRAALKALPERDRAVVVLKVVEGMSYQEIAEALDLTPSNVGYILHHGLKKLASRLGKGGTS